MDGPDPLEVAVLEADVAFLRLALLDARQRLDDAVLKAPFSGFVSAVNVEEGDEVQANATIVEVVDPSVIEVDGIVDEIDVLQVQLGTRVGVTVDALQGTLLEGRVTEISPGAGNQQGVVTYPIRIELETPENLQLREGLSAVANIVLREERNVLLLPQKAIYGSFDQPMVRVLNGAGEIEERAVVLGDTDDFWVAVRSGLNEGDQVAMESAEVGTSQFSFRQFRRVTGGSGRGGSGGASRGGSSGGRR
jgi:RND family efflux transporter MFP subunit